jgi:hypothetical protein
MRVPGEVTEAALTGLEQPLGQRCAYDPPLLPALNAAAPMGAESRPQPSFRREETQGASYVHRSGTYPWDQRPSERDRYLVRTLATLMAYP